jgi:ribulose bisphosphate carboxylase small subunit
MNPIDAYLKATGAATAREIIAEVKGCPEDIYGRLVALESAGKARVSVNHQYKGQSRPLVQWEWMGE